MPSPGTTASFTPAPAALALMSVRSCSSRSVALDVVGVGIRVDPTHQASQLAPGLLDGVLLTLSPQRLELRRAGVLVGDEARREGAALHVGEDSPHVVLDVRVDDPRARDVVAVFGGIRYRPALFGDAALIHQVDDQLELMQAL